MFSSFFRGKKNTTNTTRRSNKNLRNAAASQAQWKVRSQYGRSSQSRVANFLRPEEGRHNLVAKEQKVLAEETFSELDAISKGITPEQEKVISSVRDTIQSQVKSATQSGADRITISVPTFVGSLLVRLLGILLVLALLGGLIAAFIVAPAITTPFVGLTALVGAQAAAGRTRRTAAGAAAATGAGAAAEAASAQWRGTSTGAVPRAPTTATTATTATKANNTPEIALHRADAVAAVTAARAAAASAVTNSNASIAAGRAGDTNAATAAADRAAAFAKAANRYAKSAVTAAEYLPLVEGANNIAARLPFVNAFGEAMSAVRDAADEAVLDSNRAAAAAREGDTATAKAAAESAAANAATAATAAAEADVAERRIAEAGFSDLSETVAAAAATAAALAARAAASAATAAGWAKYAANTNAAIAEADAVAAAGRVTRRNRPPLYPKNKVTGKVPQGIAAGRGGGGAANRNTRKNRN